MESSSSSSSSSTSTSSTTTTPESHVLSGNIVNDQEKGEVEKVELWGDVL